MAPVTNGRYLFNEHPVGYPEPGKTTMYDSTETIDLDGVPLDGGFLLKTVALSIDPYMRVRMNSDSYVTSFRQGQPLTNYGVAVVIRSENSAVKVGDHVYGLFDFQEYHIRRDLSEINPMGVPIKLRLLKNEENLPWTAHTGAGGMIGQTAFYGWKEYASPRKGDVVFVTSGAGGVGSLVVQLAKRDGLKVIACASTNEKVEYIKELGADVWFNYTTANMHEILREHGPIDIFWDNVGGEQLSTALKHAANHARFIECGMMSEYNAVTTPTITNIFQVVAKRIMIYGLLVVDLDRKYEEEFYRTIPPMLSSGELKYKEDISVGLEKAGGALLSVLKGTNTGKVVIALR